jgi:hypothetical protein
MHNLAMNNTQESEKKYSPELRILARALGINISVDEGDKKIKGKILNELKFDQYGKRENKEFRIPATEITEIDGYVAEEIDKDKFVTMRFVGDNWQLPGGYPIIYAWNKESYENRVLHNSDGGIIGWRAIDESKVQVTNDLITQVISSEKSVPLKIKGLDNFEDERDIRLGGGFRLTLRNINTQIGGYNFASTFVFDDIGPRCTGLANAFDVAVPRVTDSFTTQLTKNGLILFREGIDKKGKNLETVIQAHNAKQVSEFVLQELFREYKGSLTKLFNTLMDLFPQTDTHSVEGIFTFKRSANGIVMEKPVITDYDGVDTRRLANGEISRKQLLRLESQAKLLRAQYAIVKQKTLETDLNDAQSINKQPLSDYIDIPSTQDDFLKTEPGADSKIDSIYQLYKSISHKSVAELPDIQQIYKKQWEIGSLIKGLGIKAKPIQYGTEPTPLQYINKVINGKNIHAVLFDEAGLVMGAIAIDGTLVNDSDELINKLQLPKVYRSVLREGE